MERFLSKVERAAEARAALAEVLGSHISSDRWQLGEALRISAASWVIALNFDGQRSVAKRLFGDDAADRVRSTAAELDYLKPRMIEGTFEVNRCVAALPDAGVVILSHVPGQRLDQKISASRGAQRRQLMRKSGGFLAWYARHRDRDTNFGPMHWVRRMQSRQFEHLRDPADADLMQGLLEACRTRALATRGAPVRQAALHDDFVGMNATFHKGGIYGVDIHGEHWMAVARAAARFLVWQTAHDTQPDVARTSGIPTDDWEAFLSADVVAPEEQETTLPFFIGEQLFNRFWGFQAQPEVLANLRVAINHYLVSASQD